ncbi:MAG: hydantoinase B/oxoprolinase family protein [Desulfobacterales bacterium]
MKQNPILMEVFRHRFSSVAEEMGVSLKRTAFSPNIKERQDFSCAVFNHAGETVAQAAHIPVHLGSMPLSVKSAINGITWHDGDMVILNDPFKGGTHLPDITIVAPVFFRGSSPCFFVANRAHHADVGGMSSGSMPLSTSIFQEGIIIPPMKIVEKGKTDPKLVSFLLNNVRTPEERKGDLDAQIMANMTGIRRTLEMLEKYSFDEVSFYADALMHYAERMMRDRISHIPDGVYDFEDFLEDDGISDKKIRIHVTITIEGERVIVDFTGSGDQGKGCVNAVYAITLSAVLYVFRSLIERDIPTNGGCLKPLNVLTRRGSVVDARFPAAVAGGNVETSQRIVDVILGALSHALPETIPAASQGTMNNIAIGGVDRRTGKPFAYYETIGGGMGASAKKDGESAVHSHMTNTLNTPIEALEYAYPFMVTTYAIRKHSGGKGLHRGGDGIIREIKLLSDAEVTVLSERRKLSPYGLFGGTAGKPGKNMIIRKEKPEIKPSKFFEFLDEGDVVRIETPGGGGYGGEVFREIP